MNREPIRSWHLERLAFVYLRQSSLTLPASPCQLVLGILGALKADSARGPSSLDHSKDACL
jgi:hypothetical protein